MTAIDGDIIEEFIRHTLRFVDRIVIVNNVDVDSTGAIVASLHAEGLALDTWQDNSVVARPGMSWEEWMILDRTAILARRALAQFQADYVLLLDADEFLLAPSRAGLESSLSSLPRGAHASVPWVTYVPTNDDPPSEMRVLARLRYRRARESPQYYKVFLNRSFVGTSDASLGYGNHPVEGDSATVTLREITLAHFPVRSIRQIQNKGLVGRSILLAGGIDKNSLGYQWHRVYEKICAGKLSTADDLLDCAWHYLDNETGKPEVVFDPLPLVERRYMERPISTSELLISFEEHLKKARQRFDAEIASIGPKAEDSPTSS